MKPSIILYKTLPDDLLHRLEAHFTVTQVPNLHPETVARHAQYEEVNYLIPIEINRDLA